MKYGYAFQRQGGPMSWRNGPPVQARAADAKSLGSLSGTTLGGRNSLSGTTLDGNVFSDAASILPAPGAPEVIPGALGGLGTMATKMVAKAAAMKSAKLAGKYVTSVHCRPGWAPDRTGTCVPITGPLRYLEPGSGSAQPYTPTTAMSGLGDCGCGCGGGGGCGGGKLTIKFSDSFDDLLTWGTIALGVATIWSLLKKPG